MGLLEREDALVASFATLSGMPVFQPSKYPFVDRVSAAAAAGFGGIGMTIDDYDVVRAGGLSPADVRDVLDEHGIFVGEVEGIGEWLAVDDAKQQEARRCEERLYELTDLVNGRITATGVFTEELPPLELMIERFAGICDRAAPHGLTVALEPVVVGTLRTTREALEVVAGADRPNGGVMIDSYHFFRQGETMDEVFPTLRPQDVVIIHFADAGAQQTGILWDDCLSHRNIPGEGDFPLVEFLVRLDRMGVDAPVGVEVFSDKLWPLPIDEVLRRVASGTREVFAAARAAAQ